MKRNSLSPIWSGAVALLVLICGGFAGASAAENTKSIANESDGAAPSPYSGFGLADYAAMGQNATGGYGGGACCNGIWDGYCAEKRQWCECRVKHRCRPLGRGAGPCCATGCGQSACSPDAPVCRAAPSRHRLGGAQSLTETLKANLRPVR